MFSPNFSYANVGQIRCVNLIGRSWKTNRITPKYVHTLNTVAADGRELNRRLHVLRVKFQRRSNSLCGACHGLLVILGFALWRRSCRRLDTTTSQSRSQREEQGATTMGSGAGRGKFKGKPTGRRHFSTPEEMGTFAKC